MNYTIFSQKLAGWLMLRGFVLVSMEPDARSLNKSEARNVFFFKNSPELLTAIGEYKETYSKRG